MEKMFLETFKYFQRNMNVFNLIIFIIFFIIFFIGLLWGCIIKRKKDFIKKLNEKFYFKCIALCMLICEMIFAITSGIIQFVNRDILCYTLFITICLCITSFEWAFIQDKINIYSYSPNEETLNLFFQYLKNEKISCFKYKEMIIWISRWIHYYFKQKSNNKENELTQNLDLLLRPENDGLCLAYHHKTDFIKLCKKLCDDETVDKKINHIREFYTEIENKEYEKNIFLNNIFSDKNNIWYGSIIILHIIGCGCISKSLREVIGNFLLYIPGDVLLLLFYYGVVKQQKEKV